MTGIMSPEASEIVRITTSVQSRLSLDRYRDPQQKYETLNTVEAPIARQIGQTNSTQILEIGKNILLNPEYFAIRSGNLRDQELKERYEKIQPSINIQEAGIPNATSTIDSVFAPIEQFGFDRLKKESINNIKSELADLSAELLEITNNQRSSALGGSSNSQKKSFDAIWQLCKDDMESKKETLSSAVQQKNEEFNKLSNQAKLELDKRNEQRALIERLKQKINESHEDKYRYNLISQKSSVETNLGRTSIQTDLDELKKLRASLMEAKLVVNYEIVKIELDNSEPNKATIDSLSSKILELDKNFAQCEDLERRFLEFNEVQTTRQNQSSGSKQESGQKKQGLDKEKLELLNSTKGYIDSTLQEVVKDDTFTNKKYKQKSQLYRQKLDEKIKGIENNQPKPESLEQQKSFVRLQLDLLQENLVKFQSAKQLVEEQAEKYYKEPHGKNSTGYKLFYFENELKLLGLYAQDRDKDIREFLSEMQEALPLVNDNERKQILQYSTLKSAEKKPAIIPFQSKVLTKAAVDDILKDKTAARETEEPDKKVLLSADQQEVLKKVDELFYQQFIPPQSGQKYKMKPLAMLDTGEGKTFLTSIIEEYTRKLCDPSNIGERIPEENKSAVYPQRQRKRRGEPPETTEDLFTIESYNLANQSKLVELIGNKDTGNTPNRLDNKLIIIDEAYFMPDQIQSRYQELVERGAKVITLGASASVEEIKEDIERTKYKLQKAKDSLGGYEKSKKLIEREKTKDVFLKAAAVGKSDIDISNLFASAKRYANTFSNNQEVINAIEQINTSLNGATYGTKTFTGDLMDVGRNPNENLTFKVTNNNLSLKVPGQLDATKKVIDFLHDMLGIQKQETEQTGNSHLKQLAAPKQRTEKVSTKTITLLNPSDLKKNLGLGVILPKISDEQESGHTKIPTKDPKKLNSFIESSKQEISRIEKKLRELERNQSEIERRRSDAETIIDLATIITIDETDDTSQKILNQIDKLKLPQGDNIGNHRSQFILNSSKDLTEQDLTKVFKDLSQKENMPPILIGTFVKDGTEKIKIKYNNQELNFDDNKALDRYLTENSLQDSNALMIYTKGIGEDYGSLSVLKKGDIQCIFGQQNTDRYKQNFGRNRNNQLKADDIKTHIVFYNGKHGYNKNPTQEEIKAAARDLREQDEDKKLLQNLLVRENKTDKFISPEGRKRLKGYHDIKEEITKLQEVCTAILNECAKNEKTLEALKRDEKKLVTAQSLTDDNSQKTKGNKLKQIGTTQPIEDNEEYQNQNKIKSFQEQLNGINEANSNNSSGTKALEELKSQAEKLNVEIHEFKIKQETEISKLNQDYEKLKEEKNKNIAATTLQAAARRRVVKEQNDKEASAAVKIQATARGMIDRNKVKQQNLNSAVSNVLSKVLENVGKTIEEKNAAATTLSTAQYDDKSKKPEENNLLAESAVKIQTAWKRKLARKELLRNESNAKQAAEAALVQITEAVASNLTAQGTGEEAAAVKIQKIARGYIARNSVEEEKYYSEFGYKKLERGNKEVEGAVDPKVSEKLYEGTIIYEPKKLPTPSPQKPSGKTFENYQIRLKPLAIKERVEDKIVLNLVKAQQAATDFISNPGDEAKESDKFSSEEATRITKIINEKNFIKNTLEFANQARGINNAIYEGSADKSYSNIGQNEEPGLIAWKKFVQDKEIDLGNHNIKDYFDAMKELSYQYQVVCKAEKIFTGRENNLRKDEEIGMRLANIPKAFHKILIRKSQESSRGQSSGEKER